MYTIEKFFSSALWFSFGLVLNRIKYILLSIIVLRLGSTNLAIFYVSFYLINEFSSLANRLVSSSYNRSLRDQSFISSRKNLQAAINSCLQLSFILGLGSAVIIFLLASPIAFLIRDDTFVQTIKLLSLATPFLIITHQIIQVLTVLARYKTAVILHNIIEAASTLVFAYLTVFVFKSGVYAVLVWQVGAIILSSFLAIFLLYRTLPSFHLSLKPLPIPARTSTTILFNALFIMLWAQADIFIVGFYFGATKLGNYIALLVAPHLVYAIATNIFGMFLHVASSFYENPKKITFFAQKVTQLAITLATPLTIFLILYPQETLRSILRIHAEVDPLALKIFSLAFLIRIIAWVGGQVLIVARKASLNMKINVNLSLLAIPLLIFVTPRYGFLGIAGVTLGLAVFEVLTKTFLTYLKTGTAFISVKTIKILLVGFGFYIINRFILFFDFEFFLLSFPIAFLVALWLFKCLERNDWVLFWTKTQSKRLISTEENTL